MRVKAISGTANEALSRGGYQNGLNVRLDGRRVTCTLADPGQPGGWGTRQIDMIECLIPHVRKFVQVRQVVARAQALSLSLSGLLDNDRGASSWTAVDAFWRPMTAPLKSSGKATAWSTAVVPWGPGFPPITPDSKSFCRTRCRPWAAKPAAVR